ncbi:MAG TPA: hypothetical protein VN030_12905 [Cellvibrio sp.]|nr:hypothetical protein [Cellvibrio sp.]
MKRQQIATAGYIHLGFDTGRPLFAKDESVYKLFLRLKRGVCVNYHMTSIWRTLMTLNADAIRGRSLNPAGDVRTIVCGHITMDYLLCEGAVLIQGLNIAKPLTATKSGLYKVDFDNDGDEWRVDDAPINRFSKKRLSLSKRSEAHYAAVSGKFNNITDAGVRMPEHIIGAFKSTRFLIEDNEMLNYSLFWSEKNCHKSEYAAESLASIMQQSTANDLPVNWLIHGEGFYTFKNAAKLIKTAPLASAAQREKNFHAGNAKNQNVFFSNPSDSSSVDSLKALCEEAGLTFVGLNANHRDLRRWSTLKNAGTEIGKSAILAVAGGGAATLAGMVGAGGAGKVAETGINALISGHYYTAAACVAGTIIIGQGIYKKLLPMAASAKCTFGNGNQRWYSGDKALIKG